MDSPQPSSNQSNPATSNPLAEFQAGVTAALRSWSALRTAVEHSWGGSESIAKAEDLRANIFRFFDGASSSPRMTIDELEDNLFDYMEEEFGVVLEDNSEKQLADLIFRMYDMCSRGDVSLAREVVSAAVKATEQMGDVKSVIQPAEGDMDESDDDDDGTGGGGIGGVNAERDQTISNETMQVCQNESEAAMAYLAGNLFGGPTKPKKELPPPRQLGEPEPEKPQPKVDDDGFAMVVTKKKGKKR